MKLQLRVLDGHGSLRLYIRGRRLHHGMTGLLLTLAGVVLMWHDRRDCPWTRDL